MFDNGLTCTDCGESGFEELNGRYIKGDKTIIHEGEAICDACLSDRESNNNQQSNNNS